MTIRLGTSSWTDPTLVKETSFYPKRTMSAEERLRFYASIFPAVEVDATYYAPPSVETAGLWAERTPDGFGMDVKSYSLFTQHPTAPRTLWRDVAAALPEDEAAKRSVYLSALPDEAVDLAWSHFEDALRPLHDAHKLGAVVFQFPPWFTARRASRAYLETLPGRLPDYQLAVELRHGSWMSDDDVERTLGLLGELGLAYVCVDEPQGFKTSVPPVLRATAPFSLLRFHGHNAETWMKKGITAAERFRYLYREDELSRWVEPVRALATEADEVHVLFNNCYQDYGVRNAYQLGTLLAEGLQPGAEGA